MADDEVYGVSKSSSHREQIDEILNFKWPDVIKKVEAGQIDDQTIFAITQHSLPATMTDDEKRRLMSEFHILYMEYIKETMEMLKSNM